MYTVEGTNVSRKENFFFSHRNEYSHKVEGFRENTKRGFMTSGNRIFSQAWKYAADGGPVPMYQHPEGCDIQNNSCNKVKVTYIENSR